MSNHKNLIFFNNQGDSLNFNYNDTTDRFEGDILFDENSSDTYKTYGIYTMERIPSFEFEDPGVLSLNKFQLFNEYGFHFYSGTQNPYPITMIEPVNNDPDFHSKWIYGDNFDTLFPIGSVVKFNNSFLEFTNSNKAYTVVANKKGAIMIISDIDNASFETNYYTDYTNKSNYINNNTPLLYLTGINAIGVYDYIDSNYNNNLSYWSEPNFYDKFYNGKKLNIVNSKSNDSVVTVTDFELTDSVNYEYYVNNLPDNQDLIIEYKSKTDLPNIYNGPITITDDNRIIFQKGLPDIIKPGTEFKIVGSTLNTNFLMVSDIQSFISNTQQTFYTTQSQVLYDNKIFECVLAYTQSYADINTLNVNPYNTYYWKPSNYVIVDQITYNETLLNSQVYLTSNILYFTYGYTQSSIITLASAAELFSSDFSSFNIDLYYKDGALKADLIYPSNYAEVNFYANSLTQSIGQIYKTNERLIEVSEELTSELNYNLSENFKYNIVFDELDDFGIKITLNKEVYQEEIDFIFSGEFIDMERTIDRTIRNWLDRYYIQLNLLGINAELDYIGNSSSLYFNSIIIKSQYPNVPMLLNSVEVGSVASFHIEHSRILFTNPNSIGSYINIIINNKDYQQSTIFATQSGTASYKVADIPATLEAWVNTYGEYLTTFGLIPTNINNLLKFDITRTDIIFEYTIQNGKLNIPGLDDYIITNKLPGSIGTLISSNEVVLPSTATASFEDAGFATGMVFSLNNTLYPYDNQEYTIQYLDPNTLNLSYQGPFWGSTSSLCDTSPYVTLAFNTGFGQTACAPIVSGSGSSPFDLNQFDNTAFSMFLNSSTYQNTNIDLNNIQGSINMVDLVYIQLSDSIYILGENLVILDAINFTYKSYIDLPNNIDSLKIQFNNYNNYLYCLSKTNIWVIDPLINVIIDNISLTNIAYDMSISTNGDIYITYENSPTISIYNYTNTLVVTITTPSSTDTKTGKLTYNTKSETTFVTTDSGNILVINSNRTIYQTYNIPNLKIDFIFYEPINDTIYIYDNSYLYKINDNTISQIDNISPTPFTDMLYNNLTGEVNISDENSFKSFDLNNNLNLSENIDAYGYITLNQYDGMVYLTSQTTNSILTINPSNGWNIETTHFNAISTKIIYNPARNSVCAIQPSINNVVEITTTIETNITTTTTNSISIEDQNYGTLHSEYTPHEDIWLKSREYLRRPRENYINDTQVQFYWKWIDDQTPDFFLYDMSGDQLQTTGSYSYTGPKPLLDVGLNKYPNSDITKVSIPQYQQTVFDTITQNLDYINDSENIYNEPEAMQLFIGFKSEDEGPKQSILQLYKKETIEFDITSTSTNNTILTFSTEIDSTGLTYGQVKINNMSDETFINKGLKQGQTILLYIKDVSNINNQYTSHNNGSLFKIRDIYTNTLILDFFNITSDYLYQESTIIQDYPILGKDTYLKTTFQIIDREIGRFNTYAQTEIEDFRYKIQLNNIGKNIGPHEVFIFKDYDILEGGIDWNFLNIKRKEMLMNKNLIYPYIGAYKSIINAINFFGYNDLELNEYYRNINPKSKDFSKLFKVEIPDIFDNSIQGWSNDGDFLKHTYPNANYEETNLLNLTYDITDKSGNNILTYSIDDVTIKLQGLKYWLSKNIIPLTHKILDITGKTYFKGGNQITHKMHDVRIFNVNENMTPITGKLNEAYLMPINSGSTVYNCVIDFYSIIDGVGADKNPTGLTTPPKPFNGVELKLPDYFNIKIRTYKTYKEWTPFTSYQKGDKIIYYGYLYESTINNNRTNNPQKYDSVSPWSSNITYTPTSLAEYSNRIYVYSGLGSTASINPPVLDQGDNANWLDITEWSKINYEPVQTIDEYRRITTTYSIGVTQSTTLLNQIPPYNFTIDSNLDPFITIEIISDNGYGSIYNDKKNYEIRGIKDLTDKVVPIEQIGPFVPITII
jgi:hypothetical protein